MTIPPPDPALCDTLTRSLADAYGQAVEGWFIDIETMQADDADPTVRVRLVVLADGSVYDVDNEPEPVEDHNDGAAFDAAGDFLAYLEEHAPGGELCWGCITDANLDYYRDRAE